MTSAASEFSCVRLFLFLFSTRGVKKKNHNRFVFHAMDRMRLFAFRRFPDCKRAFQEMVDGRYLSEPRCEQQTRRMGWEVRRWCWAKVMKLPDDGLESRRPFPPSNNVTDFGLDSP